MTHRCGMVAVIGEPNAGKSTLTNCMTGGKISIVTPKAQTTRFNVRGICMHGETQLVLVDTPGIFDANRAFEKTLVQAAWAGIKDVDAVLLVADAKAGVKDSTEQLLAQLKKRVKKPLSLALNKIDKVKKETLFTLAEYFNNAAVFDRIFMISAKNGDGVEDVKLYLAGRMPESEWLYPEDHVSDLPMNVLAAEITREKLFFKLSQELPYAVTVEPEQWQEEKSSVRIAQCIIVQKEGQKKIVIGQGGSMLKQIGTSARRELEKLLGKRVHLSLFVKIREDWQKNFI